jgi:hypothetical protein
MELDFCLFFVLQNRKQFQFLRLNIFSSFVFILFLKLSIFVVVAVVVVIGIVRAVVCIE